jgi:hypothetical protein
MKCYLPILQQCAAWLCPLGPYVPGLDRRIIPILA